jgi:GntR family transcriptional repressor for pyruvate dehydrogenase complex
MPNDYSTLQPPGLVRDTLTARTVQQVIGWLKDGTLKPGGKLPSQNELVQQLRVSRTGIREALQVLAALNLIEIRPGVGCFVKTVATEYIINADVLAILLEKETILEVIEARKILEAGTTALATERASEQDFWLMEDALGRIEKALERGESVAGIAPEFHIAVAKATHNPVLAKLVISFNGLMAKAGQLVEATVEDVATFKQHELESHRELYEVIRRGDPAKATQAMIEHIEAFQALIVNGFLQAEAASS